MGQVGDREDQHVERDGEDDAPDEREEVGAAPVEPEPEVRAQ